MIWSQHPKSNLNHLRPGEQHACKTTLPTKAHRSSPQARECSGSADNPAFVSWISQHSSEPGAHCDRAQTESAVTAADNAWDHAEESGDTAFIDALLLPEYRSVNVDGSIHDKAAILASTKKNLGSTSTAAADEAWHAAHPRLTSIVITGDIAVITFTLNKPNAPKRVMSCDIFVYREGHWHALYSQHTAAGD